MASPTTTTRSRQTAPLLNGLQSTSTRTSSIHSGRGTNENAYQDRDRDDDTLIAARARARASSPSFIEKRTGYIGPLLYNPVDEVSGDRPNPKKVKKAAFSVANPSFRLSVAAYPQSFGFLSPYATVKSLGQSTPPPGVFSVERIQKQIKVSIVLSST